jgi:threonine/homoserine/homoserine lactone efflux protein
VLFMRDPFRQRLQVLRLLLPGRAGGKPPCDDREVHVVPFLLVSAVVVLTPGIDMALVTKNALLQGRTAAQAAALGINLGIFFWTIAAAVGLAAVIAASAAAFTAIKVAGALYLFYLGVRALLASRRGEAAPVTGRRRLTTAAAFRQGVASNLLNPKIAVFFTSLLPQFVDEGHASARHFLLLGALFNAMGVVWLLTYAAIAARGRGLLRQPRVQRAFERVTGVAFFDIGSRLAVDSRC